MTEAADTSNQTSERSLLRTPLLCPLSGRPKQSKPGKEWLNARTGFKAYALAREPHARMLHALRTLQSGLDGIRQRSFR